MRLKWLVVLVVILMVGLLPPPVQADDETFEKVTAGLMVLNAFRAIGDKELLEVGRQLDQGLVRQYGTTTNGLSRVQMVVSRLEPEPAKRPETKVLNSAEVNALAVPGHVYVTSGLLQVANDDELAGIMGHEMAHDEAGHCRRAIKRARITQGIGGALYLANANESISAGVTLLALATIFDYSRGEEYEADKLGAERAAKAGYAYDGLASFLARSSQKDKAERFQLLSSHPRTKRRVETLQGQGPVGTVGKPVVSTISVSFTGFGADVMARQFLLIADKEGQPVEVKDWGGDYQVILTGNQAPVLDVSIDASRVGRSGYARGGVSGIVRWQTVADINAAGGFIGSENATSTGARTYLHLGTFSQRGNVSMDVYNAWLGQSLQGKTIRALVPKVLHRLQEEERLRIANQPRTSSVGSKPAATYDYTLISVNNDMSPIHVSLERLGNDSLIGVYRGGIQIGTLQAEWFDAARTKVWVSGDTSAALQKGVTFKSL